MSARQPLLSVDSLAAMLNFEIVDHPIYNGLELQWFDDSQHGRGMLVFLTRRDTGLVDYYFERGLRPNQTLYHLGKGTGVWQPTDFEAATLSLHEDGVRASASFRDADGRKITVDIDDRDGRPRRRCGFLAPVADAITEPNALLAVWLPKFDLVRTGGHQPSVRIDGAPQRIGSLPLERLLRRRLIKYAAPIVVIRMLPDDGGDHLDPPLETRRAEVSVAGSAICLRFAPQLPDLVALPSDARLSGNWSLRADHTTLASGTWFAQRRHQEARLGLDVTKGWQANDLPALLRTVTSAVPVFRKWPTTYRWRGYLATGGARQSFTAKWHRSSPDQRRGYASLTQRTRASH